MSFDQKVIVVIEDEQDTAEMFAEMIQLIGYRVIKSPGGFRALSLIAESKPAVVLLDMMMPDLSGVDLLRMMQRDAQLATIPVVIVSAKGLPVDIKAGLDAGASFYLTKPISYSDLKSTIEQAVNPSG